LQEAQRYNQMRPPQGPQAPQDIQMLEYVARKFGYDLATEEGFAAAVKKVGAVQTQNINTFSPPTGYGLTGEVDPETGVPAIAAAPGHPDQIAAEGKEAALDKGANIFKQGLAALSKYPEQFSTSGRLKQLGRNITGGAASLGVPGAKEMRESELLAEPQELGSTMAELDIISNRLATDLSRTGLDPASPEYKTAYEDIKQLRAEISSGQPDLNTTKRKLLALGRTVYGDRMDITKPSVTSAVPASPTGGRGSLGQQRTQVHPEGTIIVNDQTGERLVKRNGRWQPTQ
jgi:hypothetical protein